MIAIETSIEPPRDAHFDDDNDASAAKPSRGETVLTRLFAPIDIAPLVFFRVFFGAMMVYHVIEAWLDRWIDFFYIQPDFHLTYPGFGWVQPVPGDGMYFIFAVKIVAALGILTGTFYRLSAAVFFLAFTYVFLLEKALYQNHYFLICLLSGLMIVIPAHRAFSIDAWRKPRIHTAVVPAVWLWLLRFQLAIPYVYGGLAKLNYDWLHGMPIGLWLERRANLPYVGGWLDHAWAPLIFAYSGLLYDLLVVPSLLWRRTRVIAYVASLAFHLANHVLWDIGIFPWFMIGVTLLFFPPDEIRRVLRLQPVNDDVTRHPQPYFSRQQRLVLAALVPYAIWQLLFPFRHFLYPGDVNWTEEGHHFAWHMMLREKDVGIRFFVYDPATQQRGLLKVSDFLNERQLSRMGKDPDMIIEFVHYVRDHYRERDRELQIRVLALASLNGRKPQLLMNPYTDYCRTDRKLVGTQPWIPPLTEPLRSEGWTVPLFEWESALADRIPDDMKLTPTLAPKGATATDTSHERLNASR